MFELKVEIQKNLALLWGPSLIIFFLPNRSQTIVHPWLMYLLLSRVVALVMAIGIDRGVVLVEAIFALGYDRHWVLTRVQQGLEKCLDVANGVQIRNLGRQLDAMLDILQLLISEMGYCTASCLSAFEPALIDKWVDELEKVLFLNN